MDRIFSLPDALAQRHPRDGQNADVRVADTIGLLEGQWLVTRRFFDRRSGQRARFSGHLVVDRAQYRETGVMRVAGGTFTSRRVLGLTALPGGTVRMWRSDGGLLCTLDLTDGTWTATHVCGGDHYTIRTEVRSAGVIVERWQVRGAQKDYDAETTLRRAAGGNAQRPRGS